MQSFQKGATLARKHEGTIGCLVPQPGGGAWSGDDRGLLVEWSSEGAPLREIMPAAQCSWRALLALEQELWCAGDAGLIIYSTEVAPPPPREAVTRR